MRGKQRGIEVRVKTYATCHQGATKTVPSIARTSQVGKNIAETCPTGCLNCTETTEWKCGPSFSLSRLTGGCREDADGRRALDQRCCHGGDPRKQCDPPEPSTAWGQGWKQCDPPESSTAWGQGCVHRGMQPSVQTNDFNFHKIQLKVSLPTMQLTHSRVFTERKKLKKLTVSIHVSHIRSPSFSSTEVRSLLSLPESFVTELMYNSCRKEKYYLLDPCLINFPILFFWSCCAACGILVPRPGIELWSSAVKVWSPHGWTARKFPKFSHFKMR